MVYLSKLLTGSQKCIEQFCLTKGIENTVNHDSLSHVLRQDTNRFSIQIANAKAVLNGMGHGVDIGI